MKVRTLLTSWFADRAAVTDPEVEREIADQRVALLYEQALSTSIAAFLSAALLLVVLWTAGNHAALALWACAVVLVTAIRVALVFAWRRRASGPLAGRAWRRRFVLVAFLGGSMWGAAGGFLFPTGSVAHQLFLGFVVGGMAAGAVPFLSAVRSAYIAFLLPCTLPLTVRLVAAGGAMSEIMGILVLFYAATMLLASHRMHETIVESLRLRYHRRQLSHSLQNVSVQLDSEISVREQAERAALEAERRVRVLADAPFEGIVIHERGVVLDVNRTMLEMLGLERDAVVGHDMLEFVAPEARLAVQQEISHPTGLPFDAAGIRADGSIFPTEVRGRDLPYEGRTVRVVSIRDVTERREAEARLRQLANYDSLTGLANRNLLREHIEQALARARRNSNFLALLHVDLDSFKIINDTLGHAAGDELLRQVAGRIKAAMRGEDAVARVGGDEFVLVVETLTGADDVLVVAQRVLASMQQRFQVDGQELFAAASVGIALFPLDGSDADTLLRSAEAALYRAKEKGSNHYEFFAHEMNAQARQRFELETSLRHALERDEFVLHYQPKVAIDTGEVLGVEALIRWRHRERGLIAPLEFIPHAEKTGLIVQIGEWVLESACAMMQRWRQRGLAPLPVAVNLSLRQLKQADIVHRIGSILARYGVRPEHLEIEITEGSLADNIEHAVDLLGALHELRVPLSIDDFGIGYSSLNHLRRFPVSTLKVDRSFTRNVPDDSGDSAIVTAVAAMAGSLGLKVVAEGVETPEQLAFLLDKGYYAAQGYLVSRPLAEDELVEWMRLWQHTLGSDGRHPLFAGTARTLAAAARGYN